MQPQSTSKSSGECCLCFCMSRNVLYCYDSVEGQQLFNIYWRISQVQGPCLCPVACECVLIKDVLYDQISQEDVSNSSTSFCCSCYLQADWSIYLSASECGQCHDPGIKTVKQNGCKCQIHYKRRILSTGFSVLTLWSHTFQWLTSLVLTLNYYQQIYASMLLKRSLA